MSNRWVARGVRTLTRAARYDALPSILLRKACHEVVRATNLEAEDLLEVLALEPYLAPKPCTEAGAVHEWRLFQDLVHFGSEDELEIIWLAIR